MIQNLVSCVKLIFFYAIEAKWSGLLGCSQHQSHLLCGLKNMTSAMGRWAASMQTSATVLYISSFALYDTGMETFVQNIQRDSPILMQYILQIDKLIFPVVEFSGEKGPHPWQKREQTIWTTGNLLKFSVMSEETEYFSTLDWLGIVKYIKYIYDSSWGKKKKSVCLHQHFRHIFVIVGMFWVHNQRQKEECPGFATYWILAGHAPSSSNNKMLFFIQENKRLIQCIPLVFGGCLFLICR